MTTLAHRFLAAHNARDLDGMLDCFTDDVHYRDLFFGDVTGREELAGMFARTLREVVASRWTVVRAVASPDLLVAQWSFDYTISETVGAGGGTRLRLPGTSWFDLRRGRCFRYREFFDRTAALHAQGIPPAVVARIVGRRSEVDVITLETAPG